MCSRVNNYAVCTTYKFHFVCVCVCFLNLIHSYAYAYGTISAGNDAFCIQCTELGNVSEQLFCTSCGQHYHGNCLCPPVEIKPIVRAGWQCPNCKICQTCRWVSCCPLLTCCNFVCLSVCRLVDLPLSLSICLSVPLSLSFSLALFLSLSLCVCVCVFVCLSVFVCLCVRGCVIA